MRRRRSPLLALLLLPACLGTPPHRPEEGRTRPPRPEPEAPRRPARAADDPWSIEAELPRSGDPARPNVKVELGVVDLVEARGLSVRAGVRGSIVQGVIDLRGSVSAGARDGRARTRSATFIVVQAGRSGLIQMTDEARGLCGPYQGLEVHVLSAGPDGARIALSAVAPGARGDRVGTATEVEVAPGQAVVLGGYEASRSEESRGPGRFDEASERRRTLVLLTVDVLG